MMLIKMNLQNNFKPVPEGQRVLEIIKAECKPSGKPTAMQVTFRDVETKSTLQNRYDFSSTGALTAMSIMINYALGLNDGDDFNTIADTPKLVGKRLLCEVKHSQGTTPREDGTFATFANIGKVLGAVDSASSTGTATTDTTSARQIIASNDLD